MSHRVILVGGGARSGKSAFATNLAKQLGSRRVMVATAQALDEEMKSRIAAHRAERGNDFETVEEPLCLSQALAGLTGCDVVLVDCLTLWLSNLLIAGKSSDEIGAAVEALTAQVERRRFHVIFVTNEVGMGIVPMDRLAREFRDLSGKVGQRIAKASDEVYFAALGIILRIKPNPVVAVDPTMISEH